MQNSAFQVNRLSPRIRNGRWARSTKSNWLRKSRAARLTSRKFNSRPAYFLVTILRSARTRKSPENRAENGFPHGFPFGFPQPPIVRPEQPARYEVPKPETGRGKNRGKGGSDPT